MLYSTESYLHIQQTRNNISIHLELCSGHLANTSSIFILLVVYFCFSDILREASGSQAAKQ